MSDEELHDARTASRCYAAQQPQIDQLHSILRSNGFVLRLSQSTPGQIKLADGRPAGEFILASDDIGYFRAFYNEEVEATRETWQDKQGVPGYRWWKWRIGDEVAEELPGQALTVEAGHYVLGGKTYVGNPSGDWAETTIVELRADGDLHDGVKLKGTPGGVFRVR